MTDARSALRTGLIVFTALLAGCAERPPTPGQNRAASSPERRIIQAHRGAGNLAPENTLPTFKLAWSMGVIPEADVRTTRDGVIVAFHDTTFKRLVRNASSSLQKQGVSDLTWSELSRLDVGAYKGPAFEGQHVPRIEDAFAAMKGRPERRLYLDVKDVPLETMADMARRYGVDRQVILASTHDDLVRRWKELLPTSHTLLWMGGTQASLAARLDKLRESGFAGVTQLQIHVNVGDLARDDPFDPPSDFLRSVAEELHQRGILFQVLPRNTQDRSAYVRLMELGVDSFATDDPRVALDAVTEYTARRHD